MVRAFEQGWRPGRAAHLVLGLFLLGGVFAVAGRGDRLRAAPPRDAGKKAPAKGKETPVPWPTAPKLTIVAEDADVPEMARLINDKLLEGWKANKVVPARYADDFEFIRRASLDIIGRIAKPEEIRRYLQDPAEKRRSLLIERLLASPEYATHWASVWSNWLLTRSGPFGRGVYHDQTAAWLKKQFEQNKKYSEIVEQLLTAKGKNTENGAVNFILAHVGENVPAANQAEYGRFEMVPITSRVTRLFLGTQVQCCQCHDHPFFNNLKQSDFWGINAFLRQVSRKGNPMGRGNMPPGPLELEDDPGLNPDGKVPYEKRNGLVLLTRARFLPSGEEDDPDRVKAKVGPDAPPRRQQLAGFVIAHENFPRAIVNRMWGVFFGKGFVNPIDDFNENTTADLTETNRALLNEMAARFKHYNYDLKKLIRWICNSNAYNLSCVANRTNDKPEKEVLFSRMLLKSLSPEQLFESLQVATNSLAYEDQKAKKDLKEQWLKNLIANFGDDEGNEVNFNGTVVQALMMMNGKDINEAITRDKGTVAVAVARHRGLAAGVIHDLYLASLNRPPSVLEVRTILGKFPLLRGQQADMKRPAARYEDLFWALLNSNEFLLNH